MVESHNQILLALSQHCDFTRIEHVCAHVLLHAVEHQPVDVSLQQLVKSGLFAGVTTGQGYRDEWLYD